jgi:hypoxanthine phosphoribosyltransferase
MNNKSKVKIISWEEFDRAIGNLAYLLKSFNISGVHGISRGECISAILLSYKLKIPYINNLDDCLDHLNYLIIDDRRLEFPWEK